MEGEEQEGGGSSSLGADAGGREHRGKSGQELLGGRAGVLRQNQSHRSPHGGALGESGPLHSHGSVAEQPEGAPRTQTRRGSPGGPS